MKTKKPQPEFDLQKAPFGYAYHKMILDCNGGVTDYEFLDVNNEFEKITGLRGKDIIGKTVTAVLPGITDDPFDWIAYYGNIAVHGGEGTIEQHSAPLNRWYKIKAYSPEKMHFVTLFSDITGEKILAESTRHFLQGEQETINYQRLCNDIAIITGAKYVSFNLFDENGLDFTTVAIAGINQHLKKAAELIGFEIAGKKWPHDPERASKIQGKNIIRFPHLHELTGSVLPNMIITLLEQSFGLGEVYVVKIVKDGMMLGDFTVILPAGQSFLNETVAELYAQQTGLVIQKNRFRDQLREEEARLRVMTDSAQDVILMINAQGNITFCNPAAWRVFGYTAEEMVGHNLHRLLVPSHYHESHHAAFDKFKISGQGAAIGKTLELVGLHKDSHEIPVELSLSSFELSDGWYAVGIIRDISARKKAEKDLLETNGELECATARANSLAAQAEMASIAKSEFLANMSHEIRTPLNGIIGMTELLLGTGLTHEQRHFQEIVHSSGETLLTLINDILDFSKIEAKKLELEIIDFDLSSLLEDFSASMALRIHDKGLELLCDVAPDVPTQLQGDPGRLRQILTNLTGNAIKFTQKGEVAIKVESVNAGQPVSSTDNDRVLLCFSVRDTGIGIPADKIDLLFNKFMQVDASTTRQYGGTGLGLAISKQLVELMGGSIRISSTEGKGTEFRFTISLQRQPFETASRPPAITRHTTSESLKHFEGSTDRILLAEDNKTNQFVALAMLRKLGLTADVVANGLEALKALETAVYDLVLMDVQMPGMSGIEATRRIRDKRSMVLDHDIPIIAMTANVSKRDLENCREAGMNGYVSKPVSTRALADEIAKWLPEKHCAESVKIVADSGMAEKTIRPVIWDRTAMMERIMDDQTFAVEAIKIFLEDMPKHLETLEQMLKNGDIPGIRQQAHAIKGTAATLGGDALWTAAILLEENAGSADLKVVAENIMELNRHFKDLEREMSDFAGIPAN